VWEIVEGMQEALAELEVAADARAATGAEPRAADAAAV